MSSRFLETRARSEVSQRVINVISSLMNSDLARLLTFAIFTRLVLFLIAYLSYATTMNFNLDSISSDVIYLRKALEPFGYADVSWYMDIAQNGYEQRAYSVYEHANWAFYPLWPLVLRVNKLIFSEMQVSGIFVSVIFFLLALVYLYKLIRIDFSLQIAKLSGILIVIFPASYFFLRPGPESLFLFLVVTSFYCARRKRWVMAGILGALATLTRIQGTLLLIPLLYIYYRQFKESRQFNPKTISLLLIPIAQLGFMVYLYTINGNLFAGLRMQYAWDNTIAYPFSGLITFIQNPLIISYYGWDLSLVSFVFGLLAISLIVLMFSKSSMPIEYILYSILSVILIISRENLNGSLRYMLVIFPLFLMLSLLIYKRKTAYEIVFYTFCVLQVFYFINFIHFFNWAAT